MPRARRHKPTARDLAYLIETHGSGRKVAAALKAPVTTVAAWIRELKAGTYDDSDSVSQIAHAAGVPRPSMERVHAIANAPPAAPVPPLEVPDFDADPAATRSFLLRQAGAILSNPGTEPQHKLQALDRVAKFTQVDKPEHADSTGNFGALEGRLLRQVRRYLASKVAAWAREDQELREKMVALADDPDELAKWFCSTYPERVKELAEG